MSLTDIKLKRQPIEYEVTSTTYFSLLTFLKFNFIPYTNSNGIIKVIPENDQQAEEVKRYFRTRKILFTESEK